MNVPKKLKYTKEHEWVQIENNIATVGITDYAQSQLGDVVYVDVTTVGDFLEAGDTFGAIEAVKTVADAYMPLSGEVVEMNEELEAAPQLVNQDPYGQGWIIRIEISDPEEISGLLSAEAYEKLI
ncbi:MAG: glycine cleavage system protein GcvH [Prevotellaceae bacterium]|jgi:glycine cleavage system H protein|nr:glycine cleavage system protein GcvH [Prevotellaceae bacterium]